MNMRPAATRWFELLAAREDLTAAVEVLADTGRVELEFRSDAEIPAGRARLLASIESYNQLARRYRAYWPQGGWLPGGRSGRPTDRLEGAVRQLRDWERAAAPWVQRLESLTGQRAELQLFATLLQHLPEASLDFALLSGAGPALGVRLFVVPAGSRIARLPATLLQHWISAAAYDFLLAVGLPADLDSLGAELSALKGRVVPVPAKLHGDRAAARAEIASRIAEIDEQIEQTRQEINALAGRYALAETLGELNRLDWFIKNVTSLPVSENFAWVTGWTDDQDGEQLRAALAEAGLHSMIHFPPPPREAQAPVVMRNPRWVQPFEWFARTLGTPAAEEADPSLLLVVLVPLLFGYMFGDVGQGLVLFLAGLVLQRRWPVLQILVANGLASMLFGFVFGSLFGREDLIPALWLHPIEQPLAVLWVPLVGGVAVIVLGLFLDALAQLWQGRLGAWLQVEAAIVVLYLALLVSPAFAPGLSVAAGALVWYFAGSLRRAGAVSWQSLLGAAGTLLESTLQLLVNTLSFVRVGAFALAHAGLCLAFNTLAAATGSAVAGLVILLLGNVVVIMLEGLVVTIQTTRLILFEFFIRFLRGRGRMFRPLAVPASEVAMRTST
jgi:V/A-type H+-transporting ATPase subunit I